ncbi:MAG: hypothetical protein ACRYHQ_09870 [Janthinobacterium lividum]
MWGGRLLFLAAPDATVTNGSVPGSTGGTVVGVQTLEASQPNAQGASGGTVLVAGSGSAVLGGPVQRQLPPGVGDADPRTG